MRGYSILSNEEGKILCVLLSASASSRWLRRRGKLCICVFIQKSQVIPASNENFTVEEWKNTGNFSKENSPAAEGIEVREKKKVLFFCHSRFESLLNWQYCRFETFFFLIFDPNEIFTPLATHKSSLKPVKWIDRMERQKKNRTVFEVTLLLLKIFTD